MSRSGTPPTAAHMAHLPHLAQAQRVPRCTALYPGAFRPAHKVHLAAILGLAARADVDEVVVVIANRCRSLPGTTLAIDTRVAQQVLQVYLRGVPKVRLEVAAHNAVTHALAYLDRAEEGDRLLLCVGEADFGSGDDRFDQVLAAKHRPGVRAEIVALPTGAGTVRATALRQALACGEDRKDEFMTALPETLTAEERETVWATCRLGLREFNDIVAPKLSALLDPKVAGTAPELRCVVPGKLDPVFALQRPDGATLYVKYAGETAEAGRIGHPFEPKPRRRLSAERRAIACLRDRLRDHPRVAVELAEVVSFDKALSVLIQSEVCAGGDSLQALWQAGRFEVATAAQVGGLLAACHALGPTVPALWGQAERDARHWQAMLALHTVQSEAAREPALRTAMLLLHSASDSGRQPGFFLLDGCPKNLRMHKGRVGLIDLELCGNVGDPAHDLGLLLGHMVLWGLRTGCGPACRSALLAALQAYRHEAAAGWAHVQARVVAFTGAGMLHALERTPRPSAWADSDANSLRAATTLLMRGLDDTSHPEVLLGEVLTPTVRMPTAHAPPALTPCAQTCPR